MTTAPKMTPPIDEPARWCRNGQIPDAFLLRKLINYQNHVMAYRRKEFARWGLIDGAANGMAGTTVLHRLRCHTGYGASHMGFVLGLGRDTHATGTNPRVTIDCKIAGGATTTETIYIGANAGGTDDAPNQISFVQRKVAVTANTTYEVTISAIDYGRVLAYTAYEIAPSEVDQATDFFHELQPGIEQPILDATRERIATGLTALYKRNGAHLYSFTTGGAASPTFTGTTWTNIIDGTTAWAASSAGVYVCDEQNGGPPSYGRLSDLAASGYNQIGVVMAVYGQVTAGGTGGEVRLYDNSLGAVMSVTGITTTEQWHVATGTIANLDTVDKLDVQARHNTGGSTVRVDAVSLYCYEA